MPVTKADVLAVLSDPILNSMNFSVDAIAVSVDEFRNVASFISSDDIQLVSGSQITETLYDREKNVLELKDYGNSPLSLGDKALILHECTHAISDIDGFNTSVLVGEVAAFLAQFTYMKISSPTPFPKSGIPKGATPLQTLVLEMLHAVERYNLHNSKGYAARIDRKDIDRLSRVVQLVPKYSAIELTWQTTDAGIPSARWVRQIIILAKHPK